jgi:hypothetical protein
MARTRHAKKATYRQQNINNGAFTASTAGNPYTRSSDMKARNSRKATYRQQNISLLSHTAICVFLGLVGKNNCAAGNHNA